MSTPDEDEDVFGLMPPDDAPRWVLYLPGIVVGLLFFASLL